MDGGSSHRLVSARPVLIDRLVYFMVAKTKKAATCVAAFVFTSGAEEKTRTSTEKPPLDPEPSVSTNSTTSALGRKVFIDFSLLWQVLF